MKSEHEHLVKVLLDDDEGRQGVALDAERPRLQLAVGVTRIITQKNGHA